MHVFKYIFQSSNNKYIQLDYVCNLSNDRLNLLILFHEFKMWTSMLTDISEIVIYMIIDMFMLPSGKPT